MKVKIVLKLIANEWYIISFLDNILDAISAENALRVQNNTEEPTVELNNDSELWIRWDLYYPSFIGVTSKVLN